MYSKLLLKSIFIIGVIFGLSGCGGSGDGDIALSDKTYNVRNIPLKDYYFVMPMRSSIDNHQYEYIMSTMVEEDIDGFIPINFNGSFSDKTIGATQIINSTSYLNSVSNTIRKIDNNTGRECIVENETILEPFPIKAKVGDSGIESTMICSDGTISKRNWMLIQDGEDVVFLQTISNYEMDNSLISTSSKYCTILEDGTVTKVKIIMFLSEIGATFTGDTVSVSYR